LDKDLIAKLQWNLASMEIKGVTIEKYSSSYTTDNKIKQVLSHIDHAYFGMLYDF
jgi:hypothetical protein